MNTNCFYYCNVWDFQQNSVYPFKDFGLFKSILWFLPGLIEQATRALDKLLWAYELNTSGVKLQ